MSNPLSTYANGIKRYVFLFLLIAFSFSKTFSQNLIVSENALPGNPYSEWGVASSADFRNPDINGFATDISVNKGSTVHFKIDGQNGIPYSIKIYRLGYYNGMGARLIADLGSFPGIKQPAGISDGVTGLLDCSNWGESSSWAIPATSVSGIYIAKIESSAGRNHIVFVVRDDASSSNILYQTNDATWQAYNGYGGNNLYNGTTNFPSGHAVKVSYNRPFFIYNTGFSTEGKGSDWYMNDCYPMLRWLERNGYDMTYISGVDVARSGSLLLNHKIFLTVGHDEYVSKEQRDNIEAARNAGVNCAFFTGNDVYWKTRWEADGSGNAFRTLVCYKEGTLADGSLGEVTCGTKCDISSPVWTGLWRMGAAFDAPLPENALTGQISWDQSDGTSIQVPFAFKNNRFWRNTSVAALGSGQTATLGNFTLGYEWDYEQYPDSYPNGRMTLSSTTINGHTHKLSLYRYTSNALVFGAGTVQWAWGLDDQHFGGTNNQASTDIQQATLNLFADMGVQPGSKQTDLVTAVASTDVIAPASAITTPATGTSLPVNTTVTISGTASDVNPVAGVEVSVDGGQTWKVAVGTTNWSYSWTPTNTGTFSIRSRGYDDTGNMEVPTSNGVNIISVTVTNALQGVCPCNIFTTQTPAQTTSNDGQAIELGVKFQSNVSGFITGVRFYKTTGNSGAHTGELYSSTGTRLAQAIFTNETTSGWQTVSFGSPVAITANTTYIAAYFSSAGNYVGTANYFTAPLANNPLTGLADGTDGANAVYLYTPSPAFPTSSPGNKPNYWVDVVFNNSIAPVANAGVNQTITLPISSVTLNGSGSTGTITSYSWTLVSGPNAPVISTPAAVSTTVTGLVQGTYVFQLSINGGVSTSQVTINVNPIPPPTANAGVNQSITLPNSSVTLDGSGSSGTITSYLWSNVSGPNTPVITTPTAVSTTVTGLIQGTYIFRLSVNGGVSTSQDTITVNPAPPPIANAGANQTINLPTSSVTLNGSGSTGTITTYSWTRISGPNTPVITTPTAVSTTVTGLIQGIYIFQLSLNGGVSVSQVTVTVLAVGTTTSIFTTQTPVQTTGNDGQPIELGVKFRSSTAGFITGVRFYKTTGNTGAHTGELYSSTGTRLAQAVFAGETATGWQTVVFSIPVAITANTTYVAAYFSSAGNYVGTANYFTSAVTNTPLTGLANGTDGANGVYKYTTSPAFPNSSPGNSPNYWVDAVFSATVAPVSNAGPNQTIALPASSVTLNGSGSTGTITSYSWTKISGPNTPVITTPNNVSTTVTGLIQGTYVFQLSVNAGASTSQVTITVNPAPPPTANAGTNQTIALPTSSVTLNGSGSTGTITSYLWTGVSGPNTPVITTPTAVSTSVTGLIQGVYVFRLSVNGGVSTAQVTITVNPAPPPVANAGTNQTITLPVSTVTLSGSASTGTITSYAWTRVSGPNTPVITTPAAVTTTVTGLIQGTYVFKLSVNNGVSTAQVTITVLPAGTKTTIFTTQTPTQTTSNDGQSIELGVKFRSSVAGFITGVRFYKTTGNSGTHTGELYSSTGTRLAQAVFANETATGWQTVSFSTPVAISANTTYIAAYFSSAGNYVGTANYFIAAVVNNPLTGLASGTDGANGIYKYTTTPAFPNISPGNKPNYWVDAVFSTSSGTGLGGGAFVNFGVITPEESTTESSYFLGQNYPNPVFQQSTRIRYSIPIRGQVELILYDIQGRLVKILVNEFKAPGDYLYDLNTSVLGKGIYFYRLHSGNYMEVKKMVVQ